MICPAEEYRNPQQTNIKEIGIAEEISQVLLKIKSLKKKS